MIADAEAELHQLETEFRSAYEQVEDWLWTLEDAKAVCLLTMRYLDGFQWEQISDLVSTAESKSFSADAAKKYCRRFMASLK